MTKIDETKEAISKSFGENFSDGSELRVIEEQDILRYRIFYWKFSLSALCHLFLT